MVRIVKQWRIIIYFEISGKSLTFLINDDIYSNMLRKLTEIQFDIEPNKIEITEVRNENVLSN